jgi:high affinity Mn2+ porin
MLRLIARRAYQVRPLTVSLSLAAALAAGWCRAQTAAAADDAVAALPSAPRPQTAMIAAASPNPPVPRPPSSEEDRSRLDARAASQPNQAAAPSDGDAGGAGGAADDTSSSGPVTLFPHSATSRYWISGQANVIVQGHGKFPARYSGPQSFTAWAQTSTTHVLTLYTGYELTPTTEVFADMEDATGNGDGNANGLAGYINLDSVRLVQGVALSKGPYLARFMIREIIPLTAEREEADRDELHLATSVPARRLEFRLGKFDMADFFDLNTWGSDSHLQFLNWTVDNNGAYDYAADTRGYTDGAILEYADHWWTARFAEALMPKTANGTYLDADIARARAENLELEARRKWLGHRAATVRLLSYLNHANMGNYEEAISGFFEHKTPTPDIISTREQGRHRYGFGLNFEQEITADVGLFGRLGWSNGRNESFAYTEDDRTLELGGFVTGQRWHRHDDRAGIAAVGNGIVAAHQEYLALGGLGFVLGDGALTYGHEKIVEGFYTAHLWRGFFASYDFQHINNPGYNQARGPFFVSAGRIHCDF